MNDRIYYCTGILFFLVVKRSQTTTGSQDWQKVIISGALSKNELNAENNPWRDELVDDCSEADVVSISYGRLTCNDFFSVFILFYLFIF